jgi:hypothetical protein
MWGGLNYPIQMLCEFLSLLLGTKKSIMSSMEGGPQNLDTVPLEVVSGSSV